MQTSSTTGSSRVGGNLTAQEIKTVYEQLGLTKSSERARFNSFTRQEPEVTFDVVIGTTSQPFA